MKLTLMKKMLIYILIPAILGLSIVTISSYIRSKDATDKNFAEEFRIIIEKQKNELVAINSLIQGILTTSTKNKDIIELLVLRPRN